MATLVNRARNSELCILVIRICPVWVSKGLPRWLLWLKRNLPAKAGDICVLSPWV